MVDLFGNYAFFFSQKAIQQIISILRVLNKSTRRNILKKYKNFNKELKIKHCLTLLTSILDCVFCLIIFKSSTHFKINSSYEFSSFILHLLVSLNQFLMLFGITSSTQSQIRQTRHAIKAIISSICIVCFLSCSRYSKCLL